MELSALYPPGAKEAFVPTVKLPSPMPYGEYVVAYALNGVSATSSTCNSTLPPDGFMLPVTRIVPCGTTAASMRTRFAANGGKRTSLRSMSSGDITPE